MAIYRIKHDQERSKVKLDMDFLRSLSLSASSKGFLAFLLSQPDNREFNPVQLVEAFPQYFRKKPNN
jgi:hypothetical protein